ncbi:MAG: hypothetical protein ACJZ83_06780 [Pseudohongiellaceae bacterium]
MDYLTRTHRSNLQWFDSNNRGRGGMVELNPLNSPLFDSNGLISNQIDAKLVGAFSGNNAEAFVGGFVLLDTHNPGNVSEGLYTIER